MTQATPTAVRVQGCKTWYHLTSCFKASTPEDSVTGGEQPADARETDSNDDGVPEGEQEARQTVQESPSQDSCNPQQQRVGQK